MASVRSAVQMSETLMAVAKRLEERGWAAELFDTDWRMAWVSPELKALVREEDEERLGYGMHLIQARQLETWQRTVRDEATMPLVDETLRWAAHDTEGGAPELLRMLAEALELDSGTPVPPELAWAEKDQAPVPEPARAYDFEFSQEDLSPMRINGLVVRLREESGELAGFLIVYGMGLPARVGALVGHGDQAMFERMARLVRPARREAAVVFADLQASGTLSRRLSSAVYFKLIRALTSELDDLVGRGTGIVGKHAGDGVTAFFLSEDLGSASAAARAAIETGRSAAHAAERAVREAGEIDLDPADWPVNVGVHWGGALYMGQIATGGRLEVTALGDEVNEAARIQETARDGQLLVSKSLIERLSPEDAGALGLDPDAVVYSQLGEIESAGEKAVRDAGGLAVTPL